LVILGEAFGAFELCSLGRRAEDLDAGLGEAVSEPRHQWSLGAYDNEIDLLPLRQCHLACDVLCPDLDAVGDLGDAGIAGGAEKLCAQGGGGYGPAERMLAAAAAHHQDSHGLNPLKFHPFLTI
jgi:hypothetical protein